LILDEPCQGLDRPNREMVLALMEEIGRQLTSTMIYVTHQEKEMIPCIQHVLKLGRELTVNSASSDCASRKKTIISRID
jgi:molybdate transport system ATP-binding protein